MYRMDGAPPKSYHKMPSEDLDDIKTMEKIKESWRDCHLWNWDLIQCFFNTGETSISIYGTCRNIIHILMAPQGACIVLPLGIAYTLIGVEALERDWVFGCALYSLVKVSADDWPVIPIVAVEMQDCNWSQIRWTGDCNLKPLSLWWHLRPSGKTGLGELIETSKLGCVLIWDRNSKCTSPCKDWAFKLSASSLSRCSVITQRISNNEAPVIKPVSAMTQSIVRNEQWYH